GESWSAAERQAPQAWEHLRGGVAVRLSDRVSAFSAFVLDEARARDVNYRGKVWRGLAGDVETGALIYQSENLELLFGRYRVSWGPNYTNPLLSQEAEPLDGLALRYRLGRRLTYSYQLARLDGISPDSDSGAVFINRYLAAHRIDLRLGSAVRLGLFESIIFAGPGRALELQFLNPLNFFHANQLNEDNNDNTFLGIDADWRICDGVILYGQLVVDDFQIERQSQGDQEPAEFGAQLGVELINGAGLIEQWDVLLRWDKVTNRTYNQKLERNRYLYRDRPLGHPNGNDFELYSAQVRRWLGRRRYLEVAGTLLRRGEGRISDVWSEPWLALSGDYTEPFPTGTIETTGRLQLVYHSMMDLHVNPSDAAATDLQAALKVSAGWERITNVGHVAGPGSDILFISAQFSLFFGGDWGLN
ncbi:MAG TPA: capsule assembly Wzi family protein, partial [candidate division Zixibacteria bacterium]|nr:capsule assembly Wzi family protein [candidate division Zixibacteria bacterium]